VKHLAFWSSVAAGMSLWSTGIDIIIGWHWMATFNAALCCANVWLAWGWLGKLEASGSHRDWP
jgi:hypothetical protein